MANNFLKIKFRGLWKNKGYNFLNIAGLGIGIACASLIFLWVEDELHYDSFNKKKSDLYIVKVNAAIDAGVMTHNSTPGPLGPSMKAEIPGIVNTCRITENEQSLLFSIGDKSLYASGDYAEPSLFSMLTLPFIQGDPKTAFNNLYSLVITEKAAKNFFGDEKNILGKTVRMDNKQDYVITGVIKNLPSNSTRQFDWVAPFQVYSQARYPQDEKWTNFSLNTLVELKPGTDPAVIDRQLYDYIPHKQGSTTSTIHAFLFGMKNWHLYNNFQNGKMTGDGQIAYVHMFSTIAWIILLIACVNFMNLATARSEKRAKEVGVRKVLGSGKRRLIGQFIGEALFMSLLAAILALVIIMVALPAFNTLVQKDLSAGLDNPFHIGALLLLALICGLVAGSYPSLYLSSFNPVFVLKGIKLKTGSAAFIRKGLVVLQFTISIVLIVGTIIVSQQIQHIKARNLGFNKDNLIQMNAQGNMVQNFPSIKQDIINTGLVENVALADHATIYGGNNTTNISWEGKAAGSLVVISQRLVSPEYIATTGLILREGRNFQPSDIVAFGKDKRPVLSDKPINVIITEAMAKLMGTESALGKTITRETDNGDFRMTVIGVIKDYVFGNVYAPSNDPVMFYCMPAAASLMYVRIKKTDNPEDALTKIGMVMKRDNSEFPFEYTFVDDQFNKMFESETLVSKLSRVFAGLAILISCLGLFGLAAYTAERRIKEIGVRKVLGASVPGITALLSRDFIKLVILSCLIAFPIAWWLMHNWLSHYQYRIEISWWVFLIASLISLIIALTTVSFQAIKAAIANPIKSLRTE